MVVILPQECYSFTAINQTVIVGEGDVHHGSDDDLTVPDHESLKHAMHAQDGGLGRVDDGCTEQRPKHSSVTTQSVIFKHSSKK